MGHRRGSLVQAGTLSVESSQNKKREEDSEIKDIMAPKGGGGGRGGGGKGGGAGSCHNCNRPLTLNGSDWEVC